MQIDLKSLSDEYLEEAAAAQFCGVKTNTMRVWSVQRKGPPRIKVGRKVLYRIESLKVWLTSQEISLNHQ